MPNGKTQARERLSYYISQLKNAPSEKDTQAYYEFLDSLEPLAQLTDKLYQRDENGAYVPMTETDLDSLKKAYGASLEKCGTYLDAPEQNPMSETRGEIVREIRTLLGQDVTALNLAAPGSGKTLPDTIKEGRGVSVDITGQEIGAVGAKTSSRIPVSYTDDKGESVRGFFTEDTVIDPGKLFRDAFEATAKEYPEYRDKFEKAIAPLYLDMKKTAFISMQLFSFGAESGLDSIGDLFEEYEGEKDLSGGKLGGAERTELMEDPDFEPVWKTFTNQIEPHIRQLGVLSANDMFIGSERVNMSRRNTAMSMVSNMLGFPDMLAKSTPMTVVNGTEKMSGVFMAYAEGKDLSNLAPDDPMYEYETEVYDTGEGLKCLAEMQMLDYICMNTDRHGANMFYKFDERDPKNPKFLGVQGIDNDMAFPAIVPGLDDKPLGSTGFKLGEMLVISEKMANAVMSLDENVLKTGLRNFELSDMEIDAAWKRVQLVQKQIAEGREYFKNMDPTATEVGKLHVISDEDWNKLSLKQLVHKSGPEYETNRLNEMDGSNVMDNIFTKFRDMKGSAKAALDNKLWEAKKHPENKQSAKMAEGARMDWNNPQWMRQIAQGADALYQEVKDADPMLMRSSREYKAMKESVKQLSEFGKRFAGMTVVPEKDRLAYQELLEDVSEKSQKYLAYKTEPKGKRAERRVDVARKLLDFTTKRVDSMKQEANEKDEEAVESMNAQLKARAQKMSGAAKRLESLKASSEKLEGVEKFLGNLAVDAQKELLQMSGKTELTPQEQNTARQHMASIVCYDIALRSKISGKTMPIPEDELYSPEKRMAHVNSISSDPGFKKLTEDLTPGKLLDFVSGNGGSKLSEEYVKAIGPGKAPQGPKPESVAKVKIQEPKIQQGPPLPGTG